MEDKLVELGLARNEAKIYLYILKKGTTTTGPVIKETGIANSRVYESLHSLVARGLVTYTVQKGGKRYSAESPEKFIVLEEERMKKISKIVPNLAKLRNTGDEDVSSAVYEGFEGFKTALKKIVDDCPEEKTIYILGFSQQQYAVKTLRTFLSNINLISKQKKHKLKVLLDAKTKETFGKDREKDKNSEVRYMPEGYISPAAIDIIDGYVYIFIWGEKPYAIMIKNEKTAESFKHYFKFLWSLAKKP